MYLGSLSAMVLVRVHSHLVSLSSFLEASVTCCLVTSISTLLGNRRVVLSKLVPALGTLMHTGLCVGKSVSSIGTSWVSWPLRLWDATKKSILLPPGKQVPKSGPALGRKHLTKLGLPT